MSEVLADLSLRLRADTAEFNQKVTKAGQSVNKFGTKSKKDLRAAQQATKENLGKITSGFGEMASGVTGQTDRMTGGLGSLVSGAAGSLKGIMGLSKGLKVFKLALVSTGVGAIVVALGSLVAYLTKTQAGMDIVSKATAAVGAVFDALLERVGFVGEAIVKLFKGDFEGAADSAKKAYEGLGDQIAKNYDDAIDRSNEEVKLREEKIKWITKEAELEEKKSALILKSKQKEKFSEEERLVFIKQAGKIQKKISTQNISLKQQELDIAKRIDAQGITTAEDRENLANMGKEIIMLKKQENDKIREIVNRENEVIGKVKAQRAEQQAVNEALAARKPIMTDIAGISVPALKLDGLSDLSDRIKPITADFSELRETLRSTGIGFQDLQDFSLGLDLLPVGEQLDMVQLKLDQLIPTFQTMGEALASAGNQFGTSLQQAAVQGGQSLDQLAATAKESAHSIVRSLIAQGVAAMVKSALMASASLGPLGLALAPGLAAAAGAVATSAFSSMIPAFADGGVAPGGMAMVGERGPELVNLAKGSRVHSNEDTKKMLGGSQNIHVTIESVTRGEDIHHVVKEVERRNGVNF